MITIVDYGAGNIKSVANMLRALGVASRISASPADIAAADRLILPGVGHFDYGMKALAERGLVDALERRVLEDGVPLLGICLGAQLLVRGSEEGDQPGLGWIDGEAVRFDFSGCETRPPIPHMGWCDTSAVRAHPLVDDLPADARFYYAHGYHIACADPGAPLLAAHYGCDFVAGVQRGAIAGVQFHPEKSHRFGMAFLKAFCAWTPSAVPADAGAS